MKTQLISKTHSVGFSIPGILNRNKHSPSDSNTLTAVAWNRKHRYDSNARID